MDEKIIREVAIKKGMENPELFIKFFMERFPDESNEIKSYVSEWVDRFMSGNSTGYMDNESLEIYKKLIDEQ